MKLSQRWKQTTIANRLMVILTAIMAVATLFLAVAAIFQYLTAREQSEAAKQQASVAREQAEVMRRQLNSMDRGLVEAAKQADASVDAAKAAKDSATAAVTVIEQNEDLVKAANAQARASEKSSQIASRALVVGAQAYLDVALELPKIVPDEETEFNVTIINEGNSPATLDLRWGLRFTEKYEMPIFDYSGVAAYIPHTYILPKNSRRLVLIGRAFTPDEVSKISDGKLYIFLSGKGEFLTVGQRQSMTFCYVYYGKLKSWGDCAELIQGVKENKAENLLERFRRKPRVDPSPTPSPN